METVLPKRKSHHLQGYDYSQNGTYFITICTHQRRMLFGPNRAPVGADSISARMAARVFREIIGQYPAVRCRYFLVMPNHFHALVEIERARADMESAPTFFCFGTGPKLHIFYYLLIVMPKPPKGFHAPWRLLIRRSFAY